MTAPSTYSVQRLLGRGSSGVVELAVDERGDLVALKRLALTGPGDAIERARRRIRREGEVLAGIRHPSIVPLLDLVDDGADLVLVLPYLPGGTLAERVAAAGPMTPQAVAAMAGPLLDALAEAHRHGIVHRDVTPSNVLFAADGRPVLADFGVAISREHTGGLTGAGWTVATPGFMAPEQARGEQVGPPADVFGLAATLVFALTGHGPYGAGAPELLAWRAARDAVLAVPDGLPPGMRDALAAMLHPDPDRRPTAAAVRRGPTGTLQIPAEPATPVAPTRRRAPRMEGRRVAAVAAVLAGAAVVAGGVFVWRDGGDPGASTVADRAAPAATVPCVPLPYQPCGSPLPAPFTDGRACLAGRADYDGDASNGCEVAADAVPDDVALADRTPMLANIVPFDDVDTFRFRVADRAQLLCDGAVSVRLRSPAGVGHRMEVLRGGEVVASATSVDGGVATARISDPRCGSDDSGWYTVRVRGVAGRSAAFYSLERSGSL